MSKRQRQLFYLTYCSRFESICWIMTLTFEAERILVEKQLMRILTKKRLREFWEMHSGPEEPLRHWYQVAKGANWKNLAETRQDFPHADLVGVCTIFNIGGNNFRLITKISYRTKKVFVRFTFTHSEYNKGTYKNDCECN